MILRLFVLKYPYENNIYGYKIFILLNIYNSKNNFFEFQDKMWIMNMSLQNVYAENFYLNLIKTL
jgi:hypothetical protein